MTQELCLADAAGDGRNHLLSERVVVQPDSSLDLESRRLEREMVRALVESITWAGSLDESVDRQSNPLRLQAEMEQHRAANTDCSE
ncbi:hypothetical protein NDU88_002204 [Pleurodeles waltl]|uniref:Uncharacterized protein n=1 Tax=Pleurodeles waltl TaxID=8319 RepID=A0AAV7MWQ2_PLEWA|nr:hypothetical protein NDU88_002204 [Pleurodeles waltl]